MWRTISEQDYRAAFARFGGSFKVHPDVVSLAELLSGRRVRYAGFTRWGRLLAALPLWDDHVVATNAALMYCGCRDLIDVGDEEVVFPIAPGARVTMPFQADYLTDLQSGQIANAAPVDCPPFMIAGGLTRGFSPRSPETLSKLRRLYRRFRDDGGQEVPISALSAEDIAREYGRLFFKRWRTPPLGTAAMAVTFAALKNLMFGSLLVQGGEVIAIAINYRVETPRWMLCNGVNQGVDMERGHRSLGTLLMYLNLKRAEELAVRADKQLRFSFGMLDHEYKKLWSRQVPVFGLAPARSAVKFRLKSEAV